MMVAGMIGEVPVMQNVDGVQVVNICHLIDFLTKDETERAPYKEVSARVQVWLEENDASYYADCKEDFFIYKGVHTANKEGKKIVVVDNLS